MKTKIIALLVFPLVTLGYTAEPLLKGKAPWRYEETARFKAEEARQGIAADENFLYVITNHGIGKYDKKSYER